MHRLQPTGSLCAQWGPSMASAAMTCMPLAALLLAMLVMSAVTLCDLVALETAKSGRCRPVGVCSARGRWPGMHWH